MADNTTRPVACEDIKSTIAHTTIRKPHLCCAHTVIMQADDLTCCDRTFSVTNWIKTHTNYLIVLIKYLNRNVPININDKEQHSFYSKMPNYDQKCEQMNLNKQKLTYISFLCDWLRHGIYHELICLKDKFGEIEREIWLRKILFQIFSDPLWLITHGIQLWWNCFKWDSEFWSILTAICRKSKRISWNWNDNVEE